MGRRPNPDPNWDALPGVPAPSPAPRAPKHGPGPTYQGVCKQIRAIFGTGKDRQIDEQLRTRFQRSQGTIAQARSLAASIDRVDGHAGGWQASGHQLAMMHERLDALLERLTTDGATVAAATDPWAAFTEGLTVENASRPARPHSQE